MEFKNERLFTDVVIAGGGVGGLTAAISIKERSPETGVLIIEKQTCGYSGKANRGGGVLQYFNLDRITPEQFAAFHANAIGCFLGDQDIMCKYVSMNHQMLDKLVEWGARLPKNEDGGYSTIPTGPMTEMIGVDLDITLKLRATAEKLGVKILDKTALSDVMVADGKVAGAAAYSIIDGTFYSVYAKAVILATGSQNYRVGPMWSSGRGDGIAAAYRAGAELKNTEFGNFAQLVKIKSHSEVVFGENYMYNSENEFVTRNFREHRETDISSTAIREWYVQMTSGKGPIHLDFGEEGGNSDNPLYRIWNRPYGQTFWALNKDRAAEIDDTAEVCPMLIGEQSPVSVGHDMMTSLPGLFAVGDTSYCGSGAPGAVPAPPGRNRGSGILNAVFSGILSSDGAVGYIAGAEAPAVDEKRETELREYAFAPLERKEGASAKDVIRVIQSAMCPMEQSVYMSAERIAAALNIVLEAKKLVPSLKADDLHGLIACHEAEAMVIAAEMHFRASDMRRESRGWFLREDYPETDNKNWLKWIIVKNSGGEMTFETRDVPWQDYPVKPCV